jgi:hypothetical protein
MSDSGLQTSIVNWVNANNLSYQIGSLLGLTDAILLTEFMTQIAPDLFGPIELV